MSIFDTEDNLKCKLFQSPSKETASFADQKLLFECPVFLRKRNDSLSEVLLKIMGSNLVLFKDRDGKACKFMDLTEMFSITTHLEDQKKYAGYPFYVKFKKNKAEKTFFLPSEETFSNLLSHLKKLCVLSNFNGNYEILDYLGSGHFAEVFSVRDKKTSQIFAAKIFQKKTEAFAKKQGFIIKETKLMRSLPDSPFVLKLFEVYEDAEEFILVLELLEGRDLFSMIKRIPRPTEYQIFLAFMDILKGLHFLHSQGILHRDIKPDNLVFSQDSPNSKLKIIDFSLAEQFDEGKLQEWCGTPGFMAPEILNDEVYDEKVDVFSLGVVLYMLFTGKPVFKGKNLKEVIERNRVAKISFRTSVWNNYSNEAKNIVKKMLYRDQERRISLQDIFNDKWVMKNRKIQSELTFQTTIASKTKIDESQNDLSGNLSNPNMGSVKNFSSFKRNFITRSMNKSRTEIIYSKKMNPKEETTIQGAEDDVQNEGEVNHSKYCLEPKFIGFPMSKQSLKVNSFLIYSRSELYSGSSFNNNSEDIKNPQTSKQKKSSIDSSFLPENRTHDSFEDFLKKQNDSQIFETQREEIESHILLSNSRRNPIDSRSDQDLDLTVVVPGLRFTPFRTKMF